VGAGQSASLRPAPWKLQGDTRPVSFGRAKTAKPPLEETALLDYAVKSLGSRMKSERDLRRLMAQRAAPGEDGARAMDAVIGKLKELGYLSDERFAADYTRLRQENEKFGRRRVQQGLMQKGVASATVNDAVGRAYEEVDEVALARSYAERKRMKKPEGEKEIARAMRRLVAAGFSTRAVWAVLRSWGAPVEEVDVVEGDDV
jgi:regulatory protein